MLQKGPVVPPQMSLISNLKIFFAKNLTHELGEGIGLLDPGGVVHGVAAKPVDVDLHGLAGLHGDLGILGSGGSGLPLLLNVEAHLRLHFVAL
jgi:hypothetical protein